MISNIIKPFRSAASAFLAGVSLAAAVPAYADEVVILTGVQVDFGDRVNRNPGSPFGMDAGYTVDDVCIAANDARLGMAISGMLNHMEREAANAGAPLTLNAIESLPGAPSRTDIERDLRNTRDGVCNREEPPTTVNPFTLTYASCRMSMTTPTHALVINLPPDGSTATMLMADHPNRQVMHIELTSHIDAVSTVVGSGWNDEVDMTSLGETQEIFGYDSEQYRFSYTTGLGEAGLGALTEADVEAGAITSAQAFGNLVTVETEGTAWISASAPGVEIVRSFYQNFATRVQPDESTSFFGGLIKNQVGLLDKGIPIMVDQTTRSKVMGRTSVSGYSESHVANIRIRDYGPEWCARSVEAPEDYELVDVNPGSPGMAGGEDANSGETAAAMQEASQAMQNMTPEQRQAMEQFGMGDMMQQMMGGANPAAGQAAGGAAGGAAAASAAGSRAGGSTMPPSEELNSGNLTESVERHLQALGYDVGDIDGEASMETTIAISTFQAEKGMEVTGEVSPQLLGVLSAEVDSRR